MGFASAHKPANRNRHATTAACKTAAPAPAKRPQEKAFDAAGALRQPKRLSINKIGHALHDLDPAFSSYSRSPKMAAALRALGLRRPAPVQSMYIFKQPRIGGEVVPHQDSTFL
jgi:phytanoyl-CoA hydroxylase